jgi:hypothetical protein
MVTVMFVGLPPASGETKVPAYGVITISDEGFGPHVTWSYESGVDLDCTSSWTGPNGVPQVVTVRCAVAQTTGPIFDCPLMIVSRTTDSVVGARASCDDTLEMGVGTTGTSSANLGPITDALTCAAYVDAGVLVPPYSVTCDEPGLPTATG